MDIERITNAQESIIEIFPDLQSAVTITMAMRAIEHIDKAKREGLDAYWNVAAVIENYAPEAYAPVLTYQAAALYVMEADNLWSRALGEL